MIKRMLIMLVLVGVVLGGLFGFKAFVGGKIKEVMAGMADPPQTVSTAKAAMQRLAAADRRGRQPARRERRRPLARGVGRRRRDHTSSRATTSQAGQVLLRLRADDDVAKLQALEATARAGADHLRPRRRSS